MLLHGLTATGDTWGRGYDGLCEDWRLVVPDLLGFGDSMDTDREGFSLAAHLDALDEMAGVLGLDGQPLMVAGHSMGAVLALHWAARRRETSRVVGVCAPLYRDAAEADEHIRAMGPLERLFALESPLAHGICELMCDLRAVVQWVAVLISPQWPVPVARRGVQHTWPSYLGGMNGIIRDASWQRALTALDRRGVPVLLAEGAKDPVPVAGLADHLASTCAGVTVRRHPHAGHDLPIAHPEWCLRLLLEGDATPQSPSHAGPCSAAGGW